MFDMTMAHLLITNSLVHIGTDKVVTQSMMGINCDAMYKMRSDRIEEEPAKLQHIWAIDLHFGVEGVGVTWFDFQMIHPSMP